MRKLIFIAILCAPLSIAQRCDSIRASATGDWKPVTSAPRDGTVIEMVQTYGVAPWYGLFKWVKDRVIIGIDPKTLPEKITWITEERGRWARADDDHAGVVENGCLFWHPYKPSGNKYIDPTGGLQNSTAYWCAAIGMPYDSKSDRCK